MSNALEHLKNLGSPEALRADPSRFDKPLSGNAHIHLPPNFSAFESVEQAVSLAAKEGIGVLGVSNYYDYEVYGDFINRVRQTGIFPLFGLEIICLIPDMVEKGLKVNDPGNPGKFYFCGKGITRFVEMSQAARELLDKMRASDQSRMAEMTRKVGEVFSSRGLPLQLTADDVVDMIVQRHGSPKETVTIQERHIAQAYQRALFAMKSPSAQDRPDLLNQVFGAASKNALEAVTVQNEIRSHLMKAGKPAFVEEKFLLFDEAYKLVLELGGIPCYPTLADGTNPIAEYETTPEQLVENLAQRGIYAAEFIPTRNTGDCLKKYVETMRKAGMVITAGTEHNTLDLIPIEPGCKDGAIPDSVQDIFWEGACVTAAHQHLNLHGETGYVDGTGALNSQWSDSEARIQDLAALGATVIKKYQESFSK